MSRHIFTSASLLALSAASQPTLSAVVNDNSTAVDYERIVVSATRIEQSTTAVLAPVSTIERADIERLQSTSVSDLLNKTPGATITRAGGQGSQSSIFLRGTNNEHTLILLDGQRISSATLGSTSFQYLDPEQIERIEVVRGPRSSLYGSDAIGGVIQIFSRAPSDQSSAYVTAGYGSSDAYRAGAGGTSRIDNLHVSGGISHYFTDGFSNLEDKRGALSDDDAYRNSSINATIGYDFEYGAKINLKHFYTEAKNESDNIQQPLLHPYSEGWIQSTQLSFDTPITSFWKSEISLGRSIDDSDTFQNESISSHTHFRTSRNLATWQNDFILDDSQTLVAGIDYYRNYVDSSTTYTDSSGDEIKSQDTTGYFAQYLLEKNIFDLQIGLRNDYIERIGGETTGNIALGFNLPAQHRVIFSYGTGFHAPTLNDLYWPIGIYTYGNPNLKPEKSKNYEVEFRGDYEKLNWSLSAYQNKIKNLIQWAQDPASSVGAYRPTNVAQAKLQGADFVISSAFDQWLLSTRISYVDPRDEETDLVLQKRNRRTLGFDIDRRFDDFNVGANWLVQDSRYADADNIRKLGGYGVLDLHASYEPTPDWKIALRLNNILDKEYATQSASRRVSSIQYWSDYNTERFGWFAAVTYRLQ